MMMGRRPAREAVMTALYNKLIASVVTSFTADTEANSVVLGNSSSATGLFIGLPVFGGTVPRGSIITCLSPLTLSLPPTGNVSQVPLTTGFLTTSRRLQMWDQVSAQPALFLTDGTEDSEYPNTVMQIMTLRAQIVVYSNAGANPDAVPVTTLNNLLDAIDFALLPDNRQTNQFTLGGLVSWCRRVGKVDKDPGDIGGQAIAVADVEITVP